jgi:hypothetical protein
MLMLVKRFGLAFSTNLAAPLFTLPNLLKDISILKR